MQLECMGMGALWAALARCRRGRQAVGAMGRHTCEDPCAHLKASAQQTRRWAIQKPQKHEQASRLVGRAPAQRGGAYDADGERSGLPLACGGILRRAARCGPCLLGSRQALTEAKALEVRAAQHGVERMVPSRKTYKLGGGKIEEK